ncbi:MAG TPA: hypothetical protein VF723_03160 [Pyrinomonadaceae bacterium]
MSEERESPATGSNECALVVKEPEGEVPVSDLDRDRTHCLNATGTCWNRC